MEQKLGIKKTTVVKKLPPRKKNAAPQPIGKGKAGTGKRMIYEAGGGKKALAKWRAMPQAARKVIKKTSKAVGDFDILDTIKRNPSKPTLAKKTTPKPPPRKGQVNKALKVPTQYPKKGQVNRASRKP